MKALTKRFLTGMLAATMTLSSASPAFASSNDSEKQGFFASVGSWFVDRGTDVRNGACTAADATATWVSARANDAAGFVAVAGDWAGKRGEDILVIVSDTGETLGYWIGSIDPSKLTDKEYYLESGEAFLLGDYTDTDPTNLTLGLNIASSVVGADLPMDVRDLVYDVQNIGSEDVHLAGVALDAVAVIPVIGAVKHLKHVDTIADTAKAVSNAADIAKDVEKSVETAADVADAAHDAVKAAETADTLTDAAKAADVADDIADAGKTIAKIPIDELPEEVQDMYKMYDNYNWDGDRALEDLPLGHSAGKDFSNRDCDLPSFDAEGNPLRYNEFDAYPYGSDPGKKLLANGKESRGINRFVRDNLGNVYFTDDHYETYKMITR